jgi:sugar lactone lactonase YvrE
VAGCTGGGCALGGDGGPAKNASLSTVSGVAVAPDGSVYLTDTGQSRVRKVAPNGTISTIAGNGTSGGAGDGGQATLAQLQTPRGLALGPDGSLFIAEQGGHRVRKVAPDGVISTVAGTGVAGSSGDGGPAAQAMLSGPFGVAVGLDGTLYIADTVNHRIRRVGTDGVITTVAGDGTPGFAGDDGPATLAKLREPRGLTVERDGALVLVDTENHRVRRVDANGTIRTIAGSGAQGGG